VVVGGDNGLSFPTAMFRIDAEQLVAEVKVVQLGRMRTRSRNQQILIASPLNCISFFSSINYKIMKIKIPLFKQNVILKILKKKQQNKFLIKKFVNFISEFFPKDFMRTSTGITASIISAAEKWKY
jgi:ABC-type uncharacterized transport system permease subunit